MRTDKTKALVVATCIAFILLSLRIIHTGTFNYIFLGWNIVLAWVPYLVSGWLLNIHPARKWAATVLLSVWLLFLPNAPYIITDFIHLRHRSPVPFMFDIILLFLFSFTGLALGLLSIQRAETWWKEHRLGIATSKLLMMVFLLCGFGIYLGRVERWNSWDIVTDPDGLALEIIQKLVHPISNMETWGTTLLFALLMRITYGVLKTLPASVK